VELARDEQGGESTVRSVARTSNPASCTLVLSDLIRAFSAASACWISAGQQEGIIRLANTTHMTQRSKCDEAAPNAAAVCRSAHCYRTVDAWRGIAPDTSLAMMRCLSSLVALVSCKSGLSVDVAACRSNFNSPQSDHSLH